MGERDKIQGMIEAHDMLIAFAKRRPKRKWWQMGGRQVAELETLIALSDEIFAEIQRRGNALTASPPRSLNDLECYSHIPRRSDAPARVRGPDDFAR